MLLVTGSQYPSGSDQEQEDGKSKDKPADAGALILKSSTAPAIFQPLPRAAITVAMESLESWSTMWEHSPSLLAAVLRFFDFVWQHLLDYGTALDEYRTQPTLWDVLIKVGFSNPLKVPHDHDGVVAYCHQTMAKAHAIRILALDTQATIVRSSSAVPLSAKTLLKSLANRPQLEKVLLDALATSCKPKLQTEIFTLIHQSFPEVPMEALRLPPPTHALDDSRQFGRGYLYSLPILGRKLDAFILDPTAMVGQESLVEVIDETAELNLNFSLLDAQVSHTRSWRQLFEIMLPVLRRDAAASAAVMAVATVVSQDIASEDRVAQTITTVHVERLAILLTMVELLEGMPSAQVKDTIGPLLHNVSLIFTNNALPPLDSVTRRATPLFHSPLLRIAFFLFRTLGNFEGASPAQTASLSASTDVIFRIMITATRDLLALARVSKDVEIEQDLSVAVAVVGQIVSSPFVPSPTTWLAHCHDVDLFRHAFEVFVYMEVIDGRPLYAGHILNLCLALASSTPRAAEQMALDGLMTALTNNALTAAAEAGTIDVLTMDGERTPQHEIWTSMLALVVAIVSALGESTQFVEQEVTGFARLYAAQIAVSMSWRAEGPLTLAGLEETKNAAALMYGLVHRTSGNSNVAAAYVDQGLRLLQQVVYAILHPNRLLALVEGVTPEERVWIETDTGGDTADLALRPVVGTITISLIKLAQVIVDSLLAYTMAFDVLTRESSEWRMDRAIVIPVSLYQIDDPLERTDQPSLRSLRQ
jgi:nuclear pore complex protein Nup188